MARRRSTRRTSSRSGSYRRSSSRSYRTRSSNGRRRTSSRRSAAPRTVRIVVETVAASAPQPVSLLGMKQAAAPKTARF